MLSSLVVLLLSILVSIDGYIIGFSFGLKRIRVPITIVVLIALFSSFVILFSMGIGHFIGDILPTNGIQSFAGILMIAVGFYNMVHDLPLYRRSFFLMIALFMNVDSFSYGIQAGLAERSLSFAPIAGLLIFFAMFIGVIHGHETKNRFILRYVRLLPSLLFIFLGLSKIFF
ncbi:hypothetical protein [Halalkalibacter nanhaiisediminis]|uniref:Mn2+ efflux pump MntP n=1 Tax=Halalkalibacter nanhaiisediminis TaxID=688079 RepID=A0A562QRB9_9BACI|nr:hypothetical protein [Halalkalibacter nanhaiisediminis]TWI59223.1 hypothetical protein IQ10_00936 [Halalkalibacter nanhaiisediminis]